MLLLFLAVGGWVAWAMLLPVTPDGQKFVMLRPGFSTRHISAELKAAGVIRSADAFILWHYAHHQRSLKAGEYLFDKTADARIVHDRLARGDIYVHTVVIPEGYNMFDIAQAIQDAGLGPREEFLKVAQTHTALIADLAPEAKSLEGYLFPNTYQFTRTQNMPEMASAMVKQFRQVAQEIGLTANVQKTVTMASIVEKETADGGRRLLQPAGEEYRAAGRSQRNLRRTREGNLRRRAAPRRPVGGLSLQHLQAHWAAARADCESGDDFTASGDASRDHGLFLFCGGWDRASPVRARSG